MSDFENNTIIIASYANESAAVGALAGLEHWADTRKDIELGTIGIMYQDDDDVHAAIVHEAGKGPLVSGAMGLAKSMLGPFALVGNVVGGVAHSLFGGTEEETPPAFQKLAEQMDAGRVALITVGTAVEAPAYEEQLEAMCGAVTLYEVPQEVLEAAAAGVEAAKAQKEAEEKAQKEAEKAQKEAEKAQKKQEKQEGKAES